MRISVLRMSPLWSKMRFFHHIFFVLCCISHLNCTILVDSDSGHSNHIIAHHFWCVEIKKFFVFFLFTFVGTLRNLAQEWTFESLCWVNIFSHITIQNERNKFTNQKHTNLKCMCATIDQHVNATGVLFGSILVLSKPWIFTNKLCKNHSEKWKWCEENDE